MPRSRRVPLTALLFLACSATMASATQVVQLDTRGLVRSSHDIVIGEVTASRSYWNPEHSRIFTDITVRIAESLKGAAGTVP